MPKFVVTAPDGQRYEVNAPDGATEDDAIAYVRSNMAPAAPKTSAAPDPTGSFLENAAAGLGKSAVDMYRAGKQMLGIGDQAALQAEIDEAKKLDAPLMSSGGGIVGNLAGNVAATAIPGGIIGRGLSSLPAVSALLAARPVASAVGAGVAAGGAMGALEPVATGESREENMARGAAFGAAGGLIPGALSRVVKPQPSAEAQMLLDAGVRLPPGRTLGNTTARLEQGLESLPIVGDAVKGSHRRAIEDFNRAAYSRALDPIGESVTQKTPVGYDGIAFVENKLSQAYEKVLDKIKIVRLDNEFADEVGNVVKMAAVDLDEPASRQLERIVTREIYERMTEAGTMSARTMKVAESELGRVARGLGGSAEYDKRQLADAVREVQAALRRATERSAPQHVDELRAVNEGFANFVRVEKAAARQGSREGVFTPAALRGEARAADHSVRKGNFAKGDALIQDLADAGDKVLGSKVPDSGTPYRLLGTLGLGNVAGLFEPTSAMLGGAAMLPYTSLGGRMTLAALAKRPDFAQPLSDVLRYGAPAGALFSAGASPLLAWE